MTTKSVATKPTPQASTALPFLEQQHDISASVASQLKVHLRRGSPNYNTILQAAQWQRDNYLVGQQYADTRRHDRPTWPRLPRPLLGGKVVSSLGLQQLSQLGASFIPSPLVKQALLPLVLQQPCTSLYQPAKRGLVSLIDSQQANVDALVRQSVLDLLEQERVRRLVMNSTKGYIADSAMTAAAAAHKGDS